MGFEKYSKHFNVNFSYLNMTISDEILQEKYYQSFMTKYSNISKAKNENDIILWDIRLRRSLKEIFSSASFFIEAEHVYKQKCFTSYYFLMYYSLFHAMLSTLYVDEKLTIDELLNISHSKLIKNFVNTFCNGKLSIAPENIENTFETLKYMREYYSYSMPMNEIFFTDMLHDTKPLELLKNTIKHCFQVSNFHAVMLENSFVKHYRRCISPTEDNIYTMSETFYKVHGKPNPLNSTEPFLEDSDNNAFHEMLRYGCQVAYLNIDFEHFEDEFRAYLYDFDESSDNTINPFKISGLVYSAMQP